MLYDADDFNDDDPNREPFEDGHDESDMFNKLFGDLLLNDPEDSEFTVYDREKVREMALHMIDEPIDPGASEALREPATALLAAIAVVQTAGPAGFESALFNAERDLIEAAQPFFPDVVYDPLSHNNGAYGGYLKSLLRLGLMPPKHPQC